MYARFEVCGCVLLRKPEFAVVKYTHGKYFTFFTVRNGLRHNGRKALGAL